MKICIYLLTISPTLPPHLPIGCLRSMNLKLVRSLCDSINLGRYELGIGLAPLLFTAACAM